MKTLKNTEPCKLVSSFKEFLSPLAENDFVNSILKAFGFVKDENYYQKKIADCLESTNKILKETLKKMDEISK